MASLPDHLFLINHILRCPPGVADWAIGFIQPLSPLRCKGVERKQDTNGEKLHVHVLREGEREGRGEREGGRKRESLLINVHVLQEWVE